uniref:L1 transposable element RRM domain-containing protein n=1 Tax=Acanthochromis polyacanthus TaxID=80966 RepID=A0A3Q1FKG4_9TELE
MNHFPITREQDPEVLKLFRLGKQLPPQPGGSNPPVSGGEPCLPAMSRQTKLFHSREEERSPTKKKFKETSLMSKAELDEAMLAAAKLALSEQRLELHELVKTSVGEAIENTFTPQITELRTQLKIACDRISSIGCQIERQEQSIKQLETRCDNIQASARSDKATVRGLQVLVTELTSKLADMEDRSRRSNLRLIGLAEGAEGGDAVSFLETNIPKWLPALSQPAIKIERAHRVYSRNGKSDKPHTLIFKLLNYRDRQRILQGARDAASIKHGESKISFYPDYSLETSKKRKAFSDAKKKLTSKGIRCFLRFPAILKITHRRRDLEFHSPEEAERFLQSLGSSETTDTLRGQHSYRSYSHQQYI